MRPDRSLYPGDDGFRFSHVLIRDVAYASMPKELRSRLHAHLADWLYGHAVDRLTGQDELVANHLEEAHRLGVVEQRRRDDELALRAARMLKRAGERALDRSEAAAAASLFQRVRALLACAPDERVTILPELGQALREVGSLRAAEEVLEEAVEEARSLGDERTAIRAEVELGQLQYMRGTAAADSSVPSPSERLRPSTTMPTSPMRGS